MIHPSADNDNACYELTADGRVHNISTLRYEVLGGCQNTFQTEIDGIVQLSGNLLDVTVLDGTFTELECGSTAPTNSGPYEDPESYRFATGVDGDGDFLVLEDVSNNIAVTYRRR